jgi:segregation and condensation protein B
MSEERAKMKAMLEALLFVSAEPLVPKELKRLTGMHESDLTSILEEIAEDYASRGGGVIIGRIAGGFQMSSNPEHADLIKRLKGGGRSQKLSLAALETLAIIAYKQPITKAEIEELRGVNADGMVKSLLEKRLIKIVGKKETPGRPLLYSTSREFLQYFGLNDLTELPTLKDLERDEAA